MRGLRLACQTFSPQTPYPLLSMGKARVRVYCACESFMLSTACPDTPGCILIIFPAPLEHQSGMKSYLGFGIYGDRSIRTAGCTTTGRI